MKKHIEETELDVIARAPFHVYYEGKAQMVSGINKVGKFDILPGHADFFSVMNPGDVTIATEKEDINFKISNGIIGVRGGKQVMLFVNF
jgi:F0F1-type ATP synthase epsilon subunit